MLKFAFPPTQNPKAWCWVLALGMYISYFLCRFHLRWVADANAVFSGIRALGTGAKYRGGHKTGWGACEVLALLHVDFKK